MLLGRPGGLCAQGYEAEPVVRILTYTNIAFAHAPGYQDWAYPGGNRHGGGHTLDHNAIEYSRYGGGWITNFHAWHSFESGYGGGYDVYIEWQGAAFWQGPTPATATIWNYWTNSYWWEGTALPLTGWDASISTHTNYTWEPTESRKALSTIFQSIWTLEFHLGLPHLGCYYKRSNYTSVDTTLELFAGGPTNSTEDVTLQLQVWAYDNLRERYLTWNEITVILGTPSATDTSWLRGFGTSGGTMSLTPDTNNNVFVLMQDHQRTQIDFRFHPTNGLPTNAIPGSYDFSFGVSPSRPQFYMGVDRNGDGQIELAGTNDLTSQPLPFLFWPNDDRDYIAHHNDWFTLPAYYEFDDIEPAPGTDYYLDYIHNERDVEDFAPLIIQIPLALSDTNWFLRITGGRVKLFVGGDGTRGYLDDPVKSAALVGTNGTVYLGDTGAGAVWISGLWFTNTGQLNLLFEAGQTGLFALKAEIVRVGQVIASSRVWLDIRHVKSFYDQWVVGHLDGQWPTVEYVPEQTAMPTYAHAAVRAQLTRDNDYILFVHGWNMKQWQKDAFASTAFKRLWWQGYRGRFGAFHWPTYELSISTIFSFLRNYDCSEHNAWRSGTALKQVILGLNAPGECEKNVRVMAHSMGNVVAGEALRQLAELTLTNGAIVVPFSAPPVPGTDWKYVKQYLAFQGAIPAHCYDSSPTHNISFSPWAADNLTPNRYAEYWTAGSGTYMGFTIGAEAYINYTNPDDFALKKWVIDQHTKPDESLGYSYSASAAQASFWNSGIRRGLFFPQELQWPQDRYQIFAFGIEPRSSALGASRWVGGVFGGTEVNLQASPYNFGTPHNFHSKQFRSTIALQKGFWERVLSDFGF